MKEIKLIRLEMENFKSHKHLRLDFNGRNAVISGRNATGKSSIYDSLMWLLFGKNSEGKGAQSFEVKPIGSDGNVLDHNALTSVEAVFDVSGEEVRLQRTYREKWETRRGSSEAVFAGHTSEYTVDGVPVKQNAFQQKVGELVDEDTFRLLTSITYFPRDISWQERRSILFKIAGVVDDAQILATNEQFKPLVESMGRLSLEDYKKKLLAEKKKFTGAKTEIPARISECQKTISDIEGLDFAGARAEVEKLTSKKEEISAQLLGIEHNSEAEKKALEIRGAEWELNALINENNAYRDRQTAGSVDVHGLNIRLTALQTGLTVKKRSLDAESSYISQLDGQITSHRKKWMAVNAETFSGGNCPTCGQNLPQDQLQSAQNQFEADKQVRLARILEDANSAKNAKAMAEDRFAGTQAEIMQMESEISGIRDQIAQAESNKVTAEDMADYGKCKEEIQFRIAMLNNQLHEIQDNVAGLKAKLRQEMAQLTAQISEHTAIISKESLLDYSRQRIGQLREDAKNAAECLEAIEKMLFLMDEYSRYKTRFVEDSINGLFRIARFRLFRQQANGGIEDVCDVVYNGIVYGDVNTGMKINLGIDIINTLSAAYGVRVPLFIDNAESVTDWEQINGQIIRLEARKEDKELRVSYENS